jgi:hypothetical protein
MRRIFQKLWIEAKAYGGAVVNFYKAYERHPGEEAQAKMLQAFAKGLLEFIRNLAVVSAIKFFATRADSWILHIVAEVGTFAVAATLATYITPFRFTGWNDIESTTLRSVLNSLYTMVPGALFWLLLGQLVNAIVSEIVRSQLMH